MSIFKRGGVPDGVHKDRFSLPLSSLTNISAYGDAHWMDLYRELGTYSYDDHIFRSLAPPDVYRKGWEWTQTIWGLEQLGMVQPSYSAIGVGAGRECVIFWLGDRLRRVVATDLYGNAHWSSKGGQEADSAVVENPQAFCPRPIRSEAIEFRSMDGTDLSYPDGTFDIAWSLSSIEHFGSLERSSDAVREMARVMRPGGVLALATEYILLPDETHPECFNKGQFETHVLNASPNLELIEPIDWKLPPTEYLIDSVVFPYEIERTRRHVVLNDGYAQWTSVLVFFKKK
jgi:SAM-dependent methyltransferase